MVGDHIVRATDPSGGGNILALGQHELGVGYTAIALITGDKPAVVCLLRIGHIVDNRADGTALGPALADVQRHDACGCHRETSSQKEKDSRVSCPLVNLNFQYAVVFLERQSAWYLQNELHTISRFQGFRFC